LRGLWPVVLTEMVDILSSDEADPVLVLAACKFLDFVMVLPTTAEFFNLYQWIFLADKIDGYIGQRPQYMPLVDRIASHNQSAIIPTVGSPSPTSSRRSVITQRMTADITSSNSPVFASFRNTLSRLSVAVYQNNLTPTAPDYEYIDQVLAADFCELETVEVSPPPTNSTLASPSPVPELDQCTLPSEDNDMALKWVSASPVAKHTENTLPTAQFSATTFQPISASSDPPSEIGSPYVHDM